MKLQHNKPHDSYGEEAQDRPCRFYFAYVKNGVLNTDHGPVLCRDFLSDTLVWKAKEETQCSIYGWKYTGKVEKAYTSLVIDDFGQIIYNVKSILNPIEKEIGVKLTTVELTEDGEHVWVKGDKWWMTTTVHFSWYTTLLRYLTWNKKFTSFDDLKAHPTNDWMGEVFDKFKKLPYVLPQLKFVSVRGSKPSCDGSVMHDYNGWYCNVTNNKWKNKHTVYQEQLNGLLA